mmetsp:Transcript_6836/g.10086  ORF Transcript_6836/g.10086 Transcript_6836/m.10086 type:complete len:496 (+) Transcript_6836:52-1539(+)
MSQIQNVHASLKIKSVSGSQCWEVHSSTVVRNKQNGKLFCFDYVSPLESSNEQFYEEVVEEAVWKALLGHKSCFVFCGASGTGKTHTLFGNQSTLGVVHCACESVFSLIEDSPGEKFLVRCRYLEFSESEVYDLFAQGKPQVRLFEDRNQVRFDGATELVCKSLYELNQAIATANSRKKHSLGKSGHQRNTTTCYFQIIVESQKNSEILVGGVDFLDLTAESKSTHELQVTLSKLAKTKLVSDYSSDKVTLSLKNTLQGSARLYIVAAVDFECSEESFRTMHFSEKCRQIKQCIAFRKPRKELTLLYQYQNNLKQILTQIKEIKDSKTPNDNSIEDLENLHQQIASSILVSENLRREKFLCLSSYSDESKCSVRLTLWRDSQMSSKHSMKPDSDFDLLSPNTPRGFMFLDQVEENDSLGSLDTIGSIPEEPQANECSVLEPNSNSISMVSETVPPPHPHWVKVILFQESTIRDLQSQLNSVSAENSKLRKLLAGL